MEGGREIKGTRIVGRTRNKSEKGGKIIDQGVNGMGGSRREQGRRGKREGRKRTEGKRKRKKGWKGKKVKEKQI